MASLVRRILCPATQEAMPERECLLRQAVAALHGGQCSGCWVGDRVAAAGWLQAEQAGTWPGAEQDAFGVLPMEESPEPHSWSCS